MMTIDRASLVLRKYNEYRRGNHEPCDPPYTAHEIGEAIDVAVDLLEQNAVKADIESIINAVERETEVSYEEMLGRRKYRHTTEARAIVAWLARRYAKMTLDSIGERFGRDHTTVIHYIKMVDGWLEDPRRNAEGARITNKIIKEIENEE